MMKAAVVKGPNQLVVENVPDPACDADSAIVKTHRAAICNATDCEIAEGVFPGHLHPPYPHVLGHESSGEVVEVGCNVEGIKPGDRISYWCKMSGAFGQFNKIEPAKLAIAKLDESVSFDEGAVLELVGGTMRLMWDSGIRPADKVLILGQGPAGLILLQEAKLFSRGTAVTLDLIDWRLEKSRQLGADFAFNPAKAAKEEILDQVGEVDLVIDAVGNSRGINLGIDLLRPGGRYVIFGHATEDQAIAMREICIKDLKVTGFSCPDEKNIDLINLGQRLVAAGEIQLKPLITHHVPLDDLEQGLALCRRHEKVLKVIVDIA